MNAVEGGQIKHLELEGKNDRNGGTRKKEKGENIHVKIRSSSRQQGKALRSIHMCCRIMMWAFRRPSSSPSTQTAANQQSSRNPPPVRPPLKQKSNQSINPPTKHETNQPTNQAAQTAAHPTPQPNPTHVLARVIDLLGGRVEPRLQLGGMSLLLAVTLLAVFCKPGRTDGWTNGQTDRQRE